jgi:hypothetical protein
MKLNLTLAERILIGQIVNIRLDSATLRDHILLEGVFKAVDASDIKLPIPPDFVPEEKRELFKQYDNKPVTEIADEEDRKLIQEAIIKARTEEAKIWEETDDNEVLLLELSSFQLDTIREFFEKDKRPFPKNFHKAILTLSEKLNINFTKQN